MEKSFSSPLGTDPLERAAHDGILLPSAPDAPGAQLPPPELPLPAVPVTDGTPVACHQKNAAEFLAGDVPGVMAQYGEGLFGAQQHTHSPQPAPDADEAGVKALVAWRKQSPYG